MSQTINLPALGESVTEGTITRWLVSVGDTVTVDQPIVEVSTDKVDTEIPSPIAGVVEEILVQEDQEAEVGAPLVKIGGGNAASSPAAEKSCEDNTANVPPKPSHDPVPASSAPPAASGNGKGQEIVLPALGESVTEGTITRWLVSVGDTVTVDQPIVEVSTDKVDTEIPSPIVGVVEEILVQEDQEAEVGAPLVKIGGGNAASHNTTPGRRRLNPASETSVGQSAAHHETPAAATPAVEDPTLAAKAQLTHTTESENISYVTPLVRRLATQNHVDLNTVEGTGVGGRIRKQDVLAAAGVTGQQSPAASPVTQPQQPSAPPVAPRTHQPRAATPPQKEGNAPHLADKLRGTTEKAPRIRQTIAKRMRESLRVSAQLTQVVEVDMTKIAKLRDEAKVKFQKREGVKLTFLPFFAKVITEALKQHPKLNASYDEDTQEITYHDAEHLAVAVDTPRGLLVPVINNAGELNLAGFAHKITDIAERTRSGNIGPDELSGGTFTLTNFGSTGALFDTPIINQPQSAILGTGAIVKRPVVVSENKEDTIAIRAMVYLSLTYDHRLIDGADAGRFLQTIKARLEEGRFENEIGL